MNVIIVDALGAEKGYRKFSRDVIGAGPRSIAGVLERSGLSCKIVLAEHFLTSKTDFVDNFDVMFVSGMSMDLPCIVKVISKWRKAKATDKPTVIVGGPAASDPYTLILKTKCSIAVIGEGEETLMELLKNGLTDGIIPEPHVLKNIKGIAWLDGENIRVNPLRPILPKEKLNAFFPSVERIRDYPTFWACRVYVECVRGCSNFYRTKITLPDGRKCTNCGNCFSGSLSQRYFCPQNIPPGCGYCSVPSLFGPSRSRDCKTIVKEIKSLINMGAKRIVLGASDFLDYQRDELVYPDPLTDPRYPPPNYEAIEYLLSEIIKIPEVASGEVYVSVENVKPNLFDEKAAEIISKYLPGTTIHIGCETGSELHCKLIGRPSTPREVLNAVKIAKKYGLRPYIYLIHGLPGQSEETANATINIVRKVKKYVEKITIYRFKPLPFSAFGDFPTPPPAIKDPLSRKVVNEVEKINREVKFRLIGKVLSVIVAEPFRAKKNDGIGYVISEGPVVVVKNAGNKIGRKLKVRVTRVISDRLVEAEEVSD